MYDPTLGRFLQRDPVFRGPDEFDLQEYQSHTERQSVDMERGLHQRVSHSDRAVASLYEYVQGDPVNLLDPFGKDPVNPIQPGKNMAGPDPVLVFKAILAAYNMGKRKEAEFFARVAIANTKEAMAVYDKWYCSLCDDNKQTVTHYLTFHKRLPTEQELRTDLKPCANDKAFVTPAARYVVKEYGKFSWVAVDTTNNRVVIITENGRHIGIKGVVENDVDVKDAGWTYVRE